MKTLFLTGASGFLGRRIREALGDGYRIVAPGHGECDIADPEAVRRAVFEAGADFVVHCAAVSDVAQCAREPERSWRINVDGSLAVARAAGEAGAKCVLCSSDQVYAGSAVTAPHREDELLLPAPLYGREKLAAEWACLAVNPDAVFLRLTWMYDARSWPGEKGDFLRNLLAKRRAGEPLKFPARDTRGLTDAGDVVRNLPAAFALPGGAYNFGSPAEGSVYETAREAFGAAGLDPAQIGEEESSGDRARNLAMDPAKLNACGIFFPRTADALAAALRRAEPPGGTGSHPVGPGATKRRQAPFTNLE